jgi:hypothetical protein
MNTRTHVLTVVSTLQKRDLSVWLFGGWAEELREMREPGPHSDIDLLLRAEDFDQLDSILAELPGVVEIPQKHFSHKRAVEWSGVRVEIFLVQPRATDVTVFFDGGVVFDWPADAFTDSSIGNLPVASLTALNKYRREHHHVERAYREHGNSTDRSLR